MNTARLIEIEIEAFRGFSAPVAIPLDADVVLVTGSNGSGKTSLTDALTWGLTGRLDHMYARLKGLPKTDDHLVNRYCIKDGRKARVSLRLATARGEYVLTRHGDRRGSTVHLADASGTVVANDDVGVSQAIAGATSDDFHRALSSWGVLRQDAMLGIVTDAPDRLSALFAGILGLDQLTGFVKSAKQAGRTLQGQVKEEEAALAQHEGELRKRQELYDVALRSAVDKERQRSARRLATEALDKHGRRLKGLSEADAVDPNVVRLIGLEIASSMSAVERARTATAQAQSQDRQAAGLLADAKAKHRPGEGPDAELVRLALEMADGDTCPACTHKHPSGTLHELLAVRLKELAGRPFQASPDLVDEMQRHEEMASRLREGAQQELLDVQAANSFINIDVAAPFLKDDQPLEALATELAHLRDSFREIHRLLRPDGVPGDTRSLMAGVEAQEEVVNQTRKDLALLKTRVKRSKSLEKAALESATAILQESLDDIAIAFREVYERLSPHPTFRDLELRSLGAFGANRVIPYVVDTERQVDGNPSLICSDGQMSVIALSLFLGMALSTQDVSLPFVVLDDPLQAMDVLNVLGFGDLCRRLRDERQVVVMTHDRRFASILERKLRPRSPQHSTLRVDFHGWSTIGPEISWNRVEQEIVPRILPEVA